MSNKPMIRHCRNCEWGKETLTTDTWCTVKYCYRFDYSQRIAALLCKFYKQRSDDNENPN